MEIYYDSLQEGTWFKGLHPHFAESNLIPINDISSDMEVAKALEYDRPDIILADKGKPILVIERTIEVPTGHNVGQRFARLAAAAEAKIPLVYFGPYMARKHGGATAGPRYMNLRLFYTLDIVADLNKSAVTTINWPVDDKCELLRTAEKDVKMKEYISLFLEKYAEFGLDGANKAIRTSPFNVSMVEEREQFIKKYVKTPLAYDTPPPSVKIMDVDTFVKSTNIPREDLKHFQEVVFYEVGMRYVRSDPYTGTGMLYQYLYVLGEKTVKRALVLHFPHITTAMWEKASASGKRKDVRLFKHIADLIILRDGCWKRTPLTPRSPEVVEI